MPDEPVTDTGVELARDEHRALGWAAALAMLAILWLIRPVGVGILLGTFLAFMMQPMFFRLRARLGVGWSASITVLVTTLTVVGTVGGAVWLFVARGADLANRLIASSGPGGVADAALADVARVTARFGVSQEDLVSHARALASAAANRAGDLAETLAATLGSTLLGLLFVMLSMHFILRNWQVVSQRAQDAFPLRPDYTSALFAEFRQVGRTAVLGAGGTSLAQGVFATLGFAIAGVPDPLFFGAATAVASLVPGVGVLLVLVPVWIGLFLVGEPGHAIFEIAWGLLLVVGVCDYVIRPRLVRGERKVPALVTFAALFGGLEVLGLEGLLVGPVVMALAVSILRLYASETRKRRNLPETPAAP